MASKCISKIARWRPPSVYLEACSITASKCIAKLVQLRPPSTSPNSHNYSLQVVLATGPNSRFGSGSGSEPELDRCNGLPPKTRHFKSTIVPPIKYLSSDHIVTWSVRRLCSFSPSFPSRSHIYDRTNIRWVAIENPHFLAEIPLFFAAIQRILVQSQIWQQEVKEGLKLHNLHIDHVMIRSEPKYFIGAKVAGTVIWNCGPVPTRPQTRWVPLFSR